MTPLTPDQLLEQATARRQLRDCPGLKESRPGVFVVGHASLVELGMEEGRPCARLAPLGHGRPETFALDDPTKRRALIDAVRLRLKRLAED
jgi:hypothetical protein